MYMLPWMPVEEVLVVHDRVRVALCDDGVVCRGEGEFSQPRLGVQLEVGPHHLVLLPADVQAHARVHLAALRDRERVGNGVWK